MQQAVKNTNSWLIRGIFIEFDALVNYQNSLYKIHRCSLLEVWVLMLEYFAKTIVCRNSA